MIQTSTILKLGLCQARGASCLFTVMAAPPSLMSAPLREAVSGPPACSRHFSWAPNREAWRRTFKWMQSPPFLWHPEIPCCHASLCSGFASLLDTQLSSFSSIYGIWHLSLRPDVSEPGLTFCISMSFKLLDHFETSIPVGLRKVTLLSFCGFCLLLRRECSSCSLPHPPWGWILSRLFSIPFSLLSCFLWDWLNVLLFLPPQ